jgi:cob(I)alamin adenosyltransferase
MPQTPDSPRPPRAPRIYTRAGDGGETGLVGGTRVAKDDLRLECYGTVDELNAAVGLARTAVQAAAGRATQGVPAPGEAVVGSDAAAGQSDDPAGLLGLDHDLARVQHQLFNLGSKLATPRANVDAQGPAVGDEEIAWLEARIDQASEHLAPLRSFILPGGGAANAALHLARTVCRRAERRAVTLQRAGGCGPAEVAYLNRLSDALFVWARAAAAWTGHTEALWRPDGA